MYNTADFHLETQRLMINLNLASATLDNLSRDFADAVGKIELVASVTHKKFFLVKFRRNFYAIKALLIQYYGKCVL